jgi:two-component system chemotaxis response regulator CheB
MARMTLSSNTSTPPRDLVVIGASAGAVPVLLELAKRLPADFPAAVLVVLHVGTHRSLLPDLLKGCGALQARHAADGQALQAGTIEVAPPDQHMLVEGDRIRLQHGPKEHHARPAIDPLFRSAALAQGPHVIGVLLSGCLDDGTAGLRAIKQCGGMAVVQDPDDAEQPEMPRSAMAHVDVDCCMPGSELADILMRLVARPLVPSATGTVARATR